jgi:multidrug efflux system membrane fusion protein
MKTPALPRTRALVFAAGLAAAAALAGCNKKPTEAPAAKDPEVIVATAAVRPVLEYEDFIGKLEAYEDVKVQAQVTGELTRVFFRDGQHVVKGDPLFEIDSKIFRAQLKSAEAGVKQADARLKLARLEVARQKGLLGQGASQSDVDKAQAEVEGAEGNLEYNQAAVEMARRNVDYTLITAQYTGRVSDRRVHPGAIVKANETILTTLVVLNPIYVTFDIDERTLLRLRGLIDEGRIPSARESRLQFKVGLAEPDVGKAKVGSVVPKPSDQQDYPFDAVWAFSDNQLDPGTGTLRVKGRLDNPALRLSNVRAPLAALAGFAAARDAERLTLKLFSPGMFVRVRFPVGAPREMVLVPDEALGSDQGQKFVYVIKPDNTAEYRRVQPGPQEGALRAVDERKPSDPAGIGIARDERVVVSGHQRVKPGQKVTVRGDGKKK